MLRPCRGDRRDLVEWSWTLDADRIPRPLRAGAEGRLTVTTRGGPATVEASYLVRNDGSGFVLDVWTPSWAKYELSSEVRLECAPLRLGGTRTYFQCPGPHRGPPCGARVLKLYWPYGSAQGFACRDCHELAYRSSQERARSVEELRAYVERTWKPLPSLRTVERRLERLASAPVTPDEVGSAARARSR